MYHHERYRGVQSVNTVGNTKPLPNAPLRQIDCSSLVLQAGNTEREENMLVSTLRRCAWKPNLQSAAWNVVNTNQTFRGLMSLTDGEKFHAESR